MDCLYLSGVIGLWGGVGSKQALEHVNPLAASGAVWDVCVEAVMQAR